MSSEKKSIFNINFDTTLRQLFCDLSRDKSPLHLDDSYARRTSFGRPVVYGALFTLFCFLKIDANKKKRIKSLQASFHHPIYWNRDYALEILHDGSKTVCRVRSGRLSCCQITFNDGDLDPVPLRPSKETDLYDFNPAALKRFSKSFKWTPSSYEKAILRSLCWLSYYTGVIKPGRSALLTEFNINFSLSKASDKSVSILNQEVDERFGLLTTTALMGKSAVQVKSFSRATLKLQNLKFDSFHFENERFFITGSSRGIGFYLGQAVERSGARVLAPSRKKLDLENFRSVAEYVKKNRTFLSQTDWIVLGASGSFEKIRWVDASMSSWMEEVTSELKRNLYLLHELIPTLKKEAKIILLSSEFVGTRPLEHSSYVLAKSFLEETLKYIMKEEPHLKLYSYKLPRFLSDRTNRLFKDENEFTEMNVVVNDFLRYLKKGLENG